MPPRLPIPCDELCRLYESGHSSVALARRYGCSPTTIANHLRRCGVVVHSSRFKTRPIAADALRRLYLEERWPIARIAAHFSVSSSTISNARRRYGIAARARGRGGGTGVRSADTHQG